MFFTRLFLVVIILLQLALASQAAQPEVGVIYFRPSDREAPSDIDSKIDTLVKAAQTAYGDEMNTDGYGTKTFTFEKNDDDTVKVNHVTGTHDDAHYLTANGWDIWAEITAAGFDQSQNIYIAFLDFSSGTVAGGWCGTGGDYLDGGLGGVVNMAIASGCFDGAHGTAILVHELGHAFGLRHDYRNHPDYNIDLVTDDPMVTSACATKWLDGHPYFNNYTTTPTGSTTITMGTPSISGSDVTITFTITDDDSLHHAHFFETITESYGFDDLSLLDCKTLSGTSDTAIFTTSALTSTTDSVSIRVMDSLGRTREEKFTVDLSALADAGAPSLLSLDMKNRPTRAEVEEWLREAKQGNLKDPEFQRRILELEQLLVALTPKEAALLPNYPNPFNPETWIPYQLSEAADVTIRIYDITGNLVRSLDLGHQGPGFYHSRSEAAYWDGKNNLSERVGSGIYFYHIQADEFSATRRMLILK